MKDYRLVGWEGNTDPLPPGSSENTAAIDVVMDAPKAITAVFEKIG